MKCIKCKYFEYNLCKKYPPQIVYRDGYIVKTDSLFPSTDYDDWCGEFKKKEE